MSFFLSKKSVVVKVQRMPRNAVVISREDGWAYGTFGGQVTRDLIEELDKIAPGADTLYVWARWGDGKIRLDLDVELPSQEQGW